MPGVPRLLPLPLLPLLLLLLLLPGGATPTFPRDLHPRSSVGLPATASYPRFRGLRGDQGSARLGLGFQLMLKGNSSLLVAARDHIYSFELGGDRRTLYPERHLTWEARDRENCAMRGRRQDECHNYIRVLVPRDPGTLLACGTNAFSPLCRTYQVGSLAQEGEELSGQARCPFDAKQSVVALFVDGSLYSATVADFQASDAVIYRSLSPGPPLRSIKYSSRWLQEPHFVRVLPYGPYVYFFFREVAVELSALGKVLVARVARVCRNDQGGSPRVLERRWTSFLKGRLQCALPGDTLFSFDVLEAVTPPGTLHGHPAVLALFGTQPNSIPGSAVCAFYLADVERAFEGPFAEPQGATGTWTAVPEDRVPHPRPGCCAGMGAAAGVGTSGDFPDEMLAFAKEHPLLHRALAPAGGRPLFTRTGTRLTQLAADTGAGPRGNQTVLFLGTEDGRVLKVLVAVWHPGATQQPSGTPAPSGSQEPGDTGETGDTGTLLLEEISLYDPGRCQGPRGASRVLGLELHPPGQELFVAFSGCLVRVPLSRCAQHGSCRRSCLASRDPYCVWLPPRGCVPFSEDLGSGFEQDVEGSTGSTGSCQEAPAAGDGDSDGDVAHGVCQPGPGATVPVPVPVLVGCVLGAFALGILGTGLLVTCCRRPSAPKGPPEPPGDPRPPPSQPPVPRLYPLLPPQGGAGCPPETPTPDANRERVPTEPRRGQVGTPGCQDPPWPGPPQSKVTLEELLQRFQGSGGGAGWAVTPPGTNRVQPGALFSNLPPPPQDGTLRRLDVPPDSPPPPPRRPLAQSHSLGGAPPRPPGLARGLTRMHSLGTPGGHPWGPRPPPTLQRSLSMKPPVLPKPLPPPGASCPRVALR